VKANASAILCAAPTIAARRFVTLRYPTWRQPREPATRPGAPTPSPPKTPAALPASAPPPAACAPTGNAKPPRGPSPPKPTWDRRPPGDDRPNEPGSCGSDAATDPSSSLTGYAAAPPTALSNNSPTCSPDHPSQTGSKTRCVKSAVTPGQSRPGCTPHRSGKPRAIHRHPIDYNMNRPDSPPRSWDVSPAGSIKDSDTPHRHPTIRIVPPHRGGTSKHHVPHEVRFI